MSHVLIIDDQVDVCTVLRMALEDVASHRVTTAQRAEDALPVLEGDTPDLVLLDAVMPGMPPVEFALHATQRGIPVVVMTGHPEMHERLDRLGWRHMWKPFRIDQILAECSATLGQLQENLRDVRASLARLLENQDELTRLIEQSRHAVDVAKAGRR